MLLTFDFTFQKYIAKLFWNISKLHLIRKEPSPKLLLTVEI